MTDTEIDARKASKRLSGGFWRRTLAWVIDTILVSALVSLVGVLAYAPTHGQVRLQQAVLMSTDCQPTKVIPAGLGLPAGFRIDDAVMCRSTFVGHEINRYVKVTQIDRAGFTVSTQWRAGTVDAEGRLVPRVLFADSLIGPLLLVGLALLEGVIGTTPGKAILGLRVLGRRSGAPFLPGALLRNLLIYGAWTVNSVAGLVVSLGGPVLPVTGGGWAVPTTLFLIMLAPIVALVFQRPDPFYDHWAGVRVSRR